MVLFDSLSNQRNSDKPIYRRFRKLLLQAVLLYGVFGMKLEHCIGYSFDYSSSTISEIGRAHV